MIFYFIIFLFSFISNLCTTPAYLSQNCELLRNLYISLIAVSLVHIVMMLFSIFMKRMNKYIRLFLLYLTIISGIALSIVIFIFYKKSTCDLKLYNYLYNNSTGYLLASTIIEMVVSCSGLLIVFIFQIEIFFN